MIRQKATALDRLGLTFLSVLVVCSAFALSAGNAQLLVVSGPNGSGSSGAPAASMTQWQELLGYHLTGIPYPTDPVPSAIMPTVPTGADFDDHEWIGTYDPLTVVTPTPPASTPVSGVYVVDAVSGSDSGNPNGSVASPRATAPTTLSAGDQIFLIGDSATPRNYSVSAFSFFSCTSSSVCWIVGIDDTGAIQNENSTDRPRFTTATLDLDGDHLIIHGVQFGAPGVQNKPQVELGDSAQTASAGYITIRHSEWLGNDATQGNGSAVYHVGNVTFPTIFTMVYSSKFTNLGDEDLGSDNDYHGFRPSRASYYNFAIANTFVGLGGDSTQVGVSGGWAAWADNPHYTYFGGNTSSDHWENAVDIKASAHTIISHNTVTDVGQSAGSATGMLTNNNEGDNFDYSWFFNNDISVVSVGIRTAGDRNNQKQWLIGNWIHDTPAQAILVAEFSTTTSGDNQHYVIHNTLTNCGAEGIGEGSFGGASGVEVFYRGNIVYDCGSPHIEDLAPDSESAELVNNFTYNSDLSDDGVSTASFQTVTNNSLDTDPGFTNAAANDYTIASGGNAEAYATEDAVFGDFEAIYGIDPRWSINDANWASGATINAGAYQ